VLRLVLGFLQKRDAGSTVTRAVAIENGQVHQRVVENMRHDRGDRLSAVNVRKAIVAGKARRVNQTMRPTVGEILVKGASCLWFRMLQTYRGAGNDSFRARNELPAKPLMGLSLPHRGTRSQTQTVSVSIGIAGGSWRDQSSRQGRFLVRSRLCQVTPPTSVEPAPEHVPAGPQVGLRRSLCWQIKAFQPCPIAERDFALIGADEIKHPSSMKPR
jgi:hypothetical protein